LGLFCSADFGFRDQTNGVVIGDVRRIGRFGKLLIVVKLIAGYGWVRLV
jgi:hypothetical protein